MWRAAAVLAVPVLTTLQPHGPGRVAHKPARALERTAAAPAKTELATQVFPGESLTYRISIRGIESARGALAVGKPKKSGKVVALRGAVEPLPLLRGLAPFSAEMVSYLDSRAGLPQRTVSNRTVDKKALRSETRYLPGGGIEVRVDGGRPIRLGQRPAGTHDALSALFSLRSRAHKPGERIDIVVLEGRQRHRVQVVAGEVETLNTTVGALSAQRYAGSWRQPGRKPRAFALWLSADDARIPVRLEGDTRLGLARFDLIAYSRPETPMPRRSARR